MTNAFDQYPQLWNERDVNAAVDSKRAANLERFFSRNTDDVQNTEVRVGDVIFFQRGNGEMHAAIIVPGAGKNSNENWIVHFFEDKVVWDNTLREYPQVVGRYRFGQ